MKFQITLRIDRENSQIAESRHDLVFDFSTHPTNAKQKHIELFLQEIDDSFLVLLLTDVFCDIEEKLTELLVDHVDEQTLHFCLGMK